MPGILAVLEQSNGQIRRTSFETITESRRLAQMSGSKVSALLIGYGVSQQVDDLGRYGVDKVFVAEDERLSLYWPEAYRDLTLDSVRKSDPSIVLFTASSTGRDLAPRVSVRLGTSLATDCISLAMVDGHLEVIRPVYTGKLLAKTRITSKPQMASLRPNVFPIKESNPPTNPEIEKISWNPSQEPKSHPLRMVASESKKIDLTEARIIVSGGRGMQGPENYKLLEELAEVLGGVVGASRAAVDSGWRPHSDQVGQTGRIVTPDLYIACGISGAIQHKVGMMNAKYIVAINKDPDAPIFQFADYGLVGDLFQIVPALTNEFRKALGKT